MAGRSPRPPSDGSGSPVRTNVLGTIYLYEAPRKNPPARRTLLAASGASYGVPSTRSRGHAPEPDESLRGLESLSGYVVTSVRPELRPAHSVRARLFGTTGSGMTGDAMNGFAKQVALAERDQRHTSLKIGNLDALRDISDIRDITRAP